MLMLRDCCEAMNPFGIVPKLSLGMDAELSQLAILNQAIRCDRVKHSCGEFDPLQRAVDSCSQLIEPSADRGIARGLFGHDGGQSRAHDA